MDDPAAALLPLMQGRRLDRRGFLLPLALLGLLALTAVVTMSFVLALGTLRDGTIERRYLEGWARASPADAIDLGGGWTLVRMEWRDPAETGTDPADGRSAYRLERWLDPFRDAQRWQAPVHVPTLVTAPDAAEPVEWAATPCGGGTLDPAGSGPLLHLIGSIRARLVPPGTPWTTWEDLGGVQVTGSALTRITDPDETTWLLSDGDVQLHGEGTVRGILLARGRVSIPSGVEWSGGVAATVRVTIEAGGSVTGDRCVIERAIALVAPPRRLHLPEAEFLGRF